MSPNIYNPGPYPSNNWAVYRDTGSSLEFRPGVGIIEVPHGTYEQWNYALFDLGVGMGDWNKITFHFYWTASDGRHREFAQQYQVREPSLGDSRCLVYGPYFSGPTIR